MVEASLTDSTDLQETRRLFLERQRQVKDSASKRSLDYAKAAVEYGKLIVTNLHLINAGGFVGLPATITLLGLADRAKLNIVPMVLMPASLYVCGLLSASLCALFAYRNYNLLALNEEAEAEQETLGFVGEYQGIFSKSYYDGVPEKFQQQTENLGKLLNAAHRNYYYAHAAGFASMGFFIAASGLIAQSVLS